VVADGDVVPVRAVPVHPAAAGVAVRRVLLPDGGVRQDGEGLLRRVRRLHVGRGQDGEAQEEGEV